MIFTPHQPRGTHGHESILKGSLHAAAGGPYFFSFPSGAGVGTSLSMSLRCFSSSGTPAKSLRVKGEGTLRAQRLATYLADESLHHVCAAWRNCVISPPSALQRSLSTRQRGMPAVCHLAHRGPRQRKVVKRRRTSAVYSESSSLLSSTRCTIVSTTLSGA
jgi:hypothetical protein